MSDNSITPEINDQKGKISLLGAVFIGIGSVVGAGIFALFGEAGTITHLRMADETKASRPVLYLAFIATSLVILLFAWYTLLTAPQTFAILVGIIILAWVVEAIWRSISKREVATK